MASELLEVPDHVPRCIWRSCDPCLYAQEHAFGHVRLDREDVLGQPPLDFFRRADLRLGIEDVGDAERMDCRPRLGGKSGRIHRRMN